MNAPIRGTADVPNRADTAHFTDQGLPVRGIVHVGANTGQEIPWYLFMNHKPLLCFEPHPVAYAELVQNYGGVAECVNLALSDSRGTLTLLVPEDGDTQRVSKFYPVPTVGHDWTTVPMTDTLNVEMLPFTEWAGDRDLSPYNTLVIDVQGMELDVLRGFGSLITGFDYLVVECSDNPVYDGEADARTVIDYLASWGFRQETPIETHDDILFIRDAEPRPVPRPFDAIGGRSQNTDRNDYLA